MCGVIGLVGFGKLNKKEEKNRQEIMRYLMTELLLLTLSRGKDATGLATLMNDGGYMGLKMGVPSPDFVARFGGTEKDYDGFLDLWRKSQRHARIALGHCRKGTTGDKEDNENNHPIKVGDVIGIHNGIINNHKEIFEFGKFKRDGGVDSEAIFRLLHYYTRNGKDPFTSEIILEVAKRLAGQYAVLAFSGNNPYQLAAFRDGRPMEFVLIKPLQLLVIASEKKFLDTVLFKMNKQAHLFDREEYPKLKKSDVDFLMMKDDSLAIFDLRKTITDTTKIEDLFVGEKIPRTAADKIWGTNTTTYKNHNTSYNAQSATKTEVDATPKQSVPDDPKKTEPKTVSTTVGKSEAGKGPGRVWNTTLRRYDRTGVSVAAEKVVNDNAGVIIDVEKGDVDLKIKAAAAAANTAANLSDGTKSGIPLETTTSPKEGDDPVPASVEQIDMENKETKTDNKKIDLETTEIEMTPSSPEAVEAAEEATSKRRKFANDDEVVEGLELVDVKTLEALPLHSLANRIGKVLFKLGFLSGYEVRDSLLKEKADEIKGTRAIRSIRTLKVINRIISSCNSDALKFDIESATAETFSNYGVITEAEFDAVVREGDRRENPLLKKVRESIVGKADR